MYAPFGAGVLLGPRDAFAEGDPFLAGGGAVDLVDLDEVVWTDPPEREEAGSPNVLGAVALHAAIDELTGHRLAGHPSPRRRHGDSGCATGCEASRGCGCSGPAGADGLPVVAVRRRRRAPRAGRRSPQRGARHRCAPRVLLRPPVPAAPARTSPPAEISEYRDAVRRGDQRSHPRRRAGQHRDLDDGGRRRPLRRRGRGRRERRTGAGPLRPGPAHRRLLAPRRRHALGGRRATPRRFVRPRVTIRSGRLHR